MAKQRLKVIEAGRLRRMVLWTQSFPLDSAKERAEKSKLSSAARQKINQRTSWQRLKLILATNYKGSDLFVTLTYDDEHLPRSREAARQRLKALISDLRFSRRATGEELLYVYNIENKHGDGRLHHHIVVNSTGNDYEQIRSLWRYGDNIDFTPIEDFGYDELAKYMTKEPREYGNSMVGARSWIGSHNLKHPIIHPAEWVDEGVRLDPPNNAHILSKEEIVNEWGRYSYIEYMLPDDPKPKHTRPSKNKTTTRAII